VIGLCLDLVGVMILGIGEVIKGAASLQSLRESYTDSFEYDVQHAPGMSDPSSYGVPNLVLRRAGLRVSRLPTERFR